MKSGPPRTLTWGLTACRPELGCAVCALLAGQPEAMRRLRNSFCEGYPPWLLAKGLGVPSKQLRSHAWRRGWLRRRSLNLPSPKYMAVMAALARLRETWHLSTKATPDKMLELLAKLSAERM